MIYFKGLSLSYEEITNLTLIEIEKNLQNNRRSLSDYPIMPKPLRYVLEQLENKLIYEQHITMIQLINTLNSIRSTNI